MLGFLFFFSFFFSGVWFFDFTFTFVVGFLLHVLLIPREEGRRIKALCSYLRRTEMKKDVHTKPLFVSWNPCDKKK